MIRDITIGQYYPVSSSIHKLDPRTKILVTFIYIISLFFIKYFVGYAFIAAALYLAIKVSRVPLQFMLKGLRGIAFILLFTVALNIFFTPGGRVLVSWHFISITEQGLKTALMMGTRLILLIVGSSLLTLTTSPIELTDGIESLLNPFRKIGVPAHEIAMMMSISLRFIPILLEETDKIMKAQMARGADFETGNIVKRAKAMIPIMVPLFISAFRRAEELAMAMEARCYRGGEGRTRMNSLQYRRRDVYAFVIGIVFMIGCIAL
ncbi:energy-coupling factor transporter transmembrane component T family protein [Cellulosilyticum sp. I15G10I2]|uniref:energy-coupling factor transporter transmembrane component T family protein n=1 Tax=Cellulosilyticum sp. I15G10I2 TaxID=1892843 RepID=UPI00085C6BCD|nr:energy-coupling factor transporter transmembrane component T [Cellulosilyticum sp. I15G10I2]